MTALARDVRPASATGGRMLALVTALLALPFAIALLLWHFGWHPDRQINHGELLVGPGLVSRHLDPSAGGLVLAASPQQAVDSFQKNRSGAARPLGENLSPGNVLLNGRWLLALAVPTECGADCLEQLHLARRVQVALNKDMTRLQRGLIGPQLHDAAGIAALRTRWPDLAISRLGDATWQVFGGVAVSAPQLFLIDPNGQLVLRYGVHPDPHGVRRDVARLLKFSWLG